MDKESFIEHARHERSHWWFVARHRIIRSVIDRLLADDHDSDVRPSIIEIGCGTGSLVDRLSSRFDAVGADISADAIAIAQSNYPASRFIQFRSIDELTGEISRARFILLLDVLEHVDDDFELFTQIASRMSAGAVMILTVPADPKLWSRHDEALFHYRRYTACRLAMLWQNLPMTPLLFSGLNWRLAIPIRAARLLGRWRPDRGSAETRSRSDLRTLPRPINRALEVVFASEAAAIGRRLKVPAEKPSRHRSAISLIAALQREPGDIPVRRRPDECPADEHQPATPKSFPGDTH